MSVTTFQAVQCYVIYVCVSNMFPLGLLEATSLMKVKNPEGSNHPPFLDVNLMSIHV